MNLFGRPSDIYHDYYDPLEYCKRKTNAISQMITTVFRTITPESARRPVGEVIAYYHKVSAATIKLFDRISLGDTIMIEGKTTSTIQKITSLEINNKKVRSCEKCEVGLLVHTKVRNHDTVYKVNSP